MKSDLEFFQETLPHIVTDRGDRPFTSRDVLNIPAVAQLAESYIYAENLSIALGRLFGAHPKIFVRHAKRHGVAVWKLREGLADQIREKVASSA